MKKLLLLAFVFIGVKAFSQGNIPLGAPGRTVEVLGKLKVDSLFILPNRTDTLFSGPTTGAVVFAYGGAWVYSGTQWARLSGIAWGTIPGLLSNQTDLQAALNAKQALITNGYGWKLSGTAGTFDSANLRKVDTVGRVNDSTLFFAINGHNYNVLLRGTAGGSIVSAISMTTPTGVFTSPAAFTNTSGSWSTTLALINQSANTVFAGPTIGSPGIPAFRLLVPADMPTGIPSANLNNSTIGFTTGTSGTDINWSAPTAALGGGVQLNFPNASSTARGPLTSSDWIRFVNKMDSVTQSGDTVYEWSNGGRNFAFVITGASGISTLNGLVAATQTFAYGTTGTSFNINSVGSIHTFNTPLAATAGTTNGGISNTDYNSFTGKQPQLTGTGYAKFTGTAPAYLTPTQVTADLNLATLSLQGLVPPAPHNGMKLGVLGGVLVWQDTTAGGGGGGSNINIGSFYRVAVPGTNNIKTLAPNTLAWVKFDSTTNTNAITIFADSGAMATYFFRRTDIIPSANLPTVQIGAFRNINVTFSGGVPFFGLGRIANQGSLDTTMDISASNAFDIKLDSLQGHLKLMGQYSAVTANIAGVEIKDKDSSDRLASPAQMIAFMGLGTAATHDVPASGNASSTQVVLGNDTRLSGGLTNPMTSPNDMIVGGASGTPTRLAAPAHAGMKPIYNGTTIGWGDTTAAGSVGSQSLDQTLKIGNTSAVNLIDSNNIQSDSLLGRNASLIGNVRIGDTLLASPPIWNIYGSSGSTNPGVSATTGYGAVTKAYLRQISFVDSALSGTGISRNQGASALWWRIPGLPVYSSSTSFLWSVDAGINDNIPDSVQYKIDFAQIIDTLHIARGWPLSKILIMSPWYCPTRLSDSFFVALDQRLCLAKGVPFLDIYHPFATAYLQQGQQIIASDSLHPSTAGQFFWAGIISNAVKFGHFIGNLTTYGNDTTRQNKINNQNETTFGTTYPLGGFSQTPINTYVNWTIPRATSFGQWGGINFRNDPATSDTGSNWSFRYIAQASRSNFDIVANKAGTEDTVIHMIGTASGGNDKIVFNGSTPQTGYQYTMNAGALYVNGSANIQGSIIIKGDNGNLALRYPLYNSGGNSIGFGSDGANNTYIGNSFGQIQFGGYSGPLSFTGHSAFNANATRLMIGTLTDDGSTPLQVNGIAKVTALAISGDNTYRPQYLPFYQGSGNYIGLGLAASNEMQISNGFGPITFGSTSGGTFTQRSQFLATSTGAGSLKLGVADAVDSNAWLQTAASTTARANIYFKPSAVFYTGTSNGHLFYDSLAGANHGLWFVDGGAPVNLLVGATTPNLQSVLTAGSTLTGDYTITNTGHTLTHTGGTDDFTGATIKVPTQSSLDNSTNAASTAYTDAAVTASNPRKFSATASSSIVTNTTTPTTIIGTGVGSQTIAANTLQVGQVIRIIGAGGLSTGIAQQATFKFVNSTASIGFINTLPSSLGAVDISFDFKGTIITTGSSGTMLVDGYYILDGANPTHFCFGTVSINTTVSQTLDIQITWASASTSNIANGNPPFVITIQ